MVSECWVGTVLEVEGIDNPIAEGRRDNVVVVRINSVGFDLFVILAISTLRSSSVVLVLPMLCLSLFVSGLLLGELRKIPLFMLHLNAWRVPGNEDDTYQ